MAKRNDWPLFEELCKRPEICNANAYGVAIDGDGSHATIDSVCHRDFAENGVCWCGKLNEETAQRDGSACGS